MSLASFQSLPTLSQTTTYFPVTSLGGELLVFKLKVPISRAAAGPNRLTSMVVTFWVRHLIGHAFPHRADRGPALHHCRSGRKCGGVGGVERGDAVEIALVEKFTHLAFAASMAAFCAAAGAMSPIRKAITITIPRIADSVLSARVTATILRPAPAAIAIRLPRRRATADYRRL